MLVGLQHQEALQQRRALPRYAGVLRCESVAICTEAAGNVSAVYRNTTEVGRSMAASLASHGERGMGGARSACDGPIN